MVAIGKVFAFALTAISFRAAVGLRRASEPSKRSTSVSWTYSELDASLLNFSEATLTHSNLGGLGPDGGEECMTISSTGSYGNITINMKIFVAEGATYEAKPEENAVHDGVASINLLNGQSTTLNVEMVDGSGTPLTLDHFYLTLLDIDAGSVKGDGGDPRKVSGVEQATFYNISEYYLLDSAQVIVGHPSANDITFTANQTGSQGDNPTSAWNMTKEQLMKSALVEFRHMSKFTMKLTIGSEPGVNGRNFMMAGISDLVTAPFGPCSQAKYLDLGGSTLETNNLAGLIPGKQKMTFANAGVFDGTSVDLVVEFEGGSYSPADPRKNGLRGTLGQINMGPQDSATFTFNLLATDTQLPIEVSNFFFSFYDIDQNNDGYETLTMTSGVGMYFLSEATTLSTITHGDGSVTFHSSAYGNQGNNPWNMEGADADEAVTFYFEEPVSSFAITYETHANAGRNFEFGSLTQAVCL